ncbi:S9 family peptidase [Pontibacter flavimaris]|uniref:Acyl-peptide hydrolase n=1 Tax=Pontibacter flavimaris TaxID=1797110 RepID=A0A1Q5PHP0_9BACT|nr:prolyl oligopeptidase family serine peptidase [Pontibacter flavimaris]OKL41735.1 peptidase S9 [Pontibacter flavimaris]
MERHLLIYLALLLFIAGNPAPAAAQKFSLESVMSHPFPAELSAAAQGARLAWTFNERGKRNVYVAEGPDFKARRLTNYLQDDGQEITGVSLSADGQWAVYVRGGEHGSIWDEHETVNPLGNPIPPKVEVWTVPFAGGEPIRIGEGGAPVISPNNREVAYTFKGQVWIASLDGTVPARPLFVTRGSVSSLEWSPDGAQLAFVSNREGHAFIGVYTNPETPITWIAPAFARDRSPRWSPDGKRLVFVRTRGAGGAPEPYLQRQHQPWSIWTAEVATGNATQLWEAPETLRGSVPRTNGGFNLHWAANERIVYTSYEDGWPHLYAIPAAGGKPVLLTPGDFAVEHVKLSPDRAWLVFSANTGPDKEDIDRRHVARVPVDKAKMELLTPGDGLESMPVLTGNGQTLAMLSATAQRPPLPAVMDFRRKAKVRLLATELIPSDHPQHKLVKPKQVSFQSADGLTVHGQLFEPKGGSGKKPAIVYIHGGPSRQMLLGWHYSDYYNNVYAMNQYLASMGFVVLSVNYRLGIGYGYDFQHPDSSGETGASEYKDIRAAGRWLAQQPQVDARRIGVYGGSYGGYLTGLALGRDSELFAAGVNIHGMSDLTFGETAGVLYPNRHERAPDAEEAVEVMWKSSPAAFVDSWTSPVLLIHADDDRNVDFRDSMDMVRRLEEKGVPYETMVLVDDTHHWMLFRNAMKVNAATADFFQRKLMQQVE